MVAFEIPGPPVAFARTRMRKATDAEIVAAYEANGSVKAAGVALGMCGQSVHERLRKLGKAKPINLFTAAEKEQLRREYAVAVDLGKLGELAKAMGRTRPFLCRQAKALGLTDQKRGKPWLAVWKNISEEIATAAFDDFKRSTLGLLQYCAKRGIDDAGFSKAMRARFPDEWEHVIELKQPKQSWYRLGRSLEYRVRDHLRSKGFFAQRSPASKTPIDVIGIAPGQVLFIQCKRSGALAPAEWNVLFDLAVSCGAKPVMASSPTGRGLEFFEMTARKDGSRRTQPMRTFEPERHDG